MYTFPTCNAIQNLMNLSWKQLMMFPHNKFIWSPCWCCLTQGNKMCYDEIRNGMILMAHFTVSSYSNLYYNIYEEREKVCDFHHNTVTFNSQNKKFSIWIFKCLRRKKPQLYTLSPILQLTDLCRYLSIQFLLGRGRELLWTILTCCTSIHLLGLRCSPATTVSACDSLASTCSMRPTSVQACRLRTLFRRIAMKTLQISACNKRNIKSSEQVTKSDGYSAHQEISGWYDIPHFSEAISD
jgi:hypothetical protein